MCRNGMRLGGYPQKTTSGVDTDTGLIAIVADTEIIDILKAQEVALGKIDITDTFRIQGFSIRVDSQAWFELDDGTQIGVHPDDGFLAFEEKRLSSLVVKDAVNFKIGYTY